MSVFRREQIVECVEDKFTRSIECDGSNWHTFVASGTVPSFLSVTVGTKDQTPALRKKFRVTIEEIETQPREYTCVRCGATVPHWTSHEIRGMVSIEGYTCAGDRI